MLAGPRGAERVHPNVILAVLSLAGAVYVVLSSAVIPALPTLQHSLNASETGVTWLLTGFLLSASVGTAIIGKLGDMYGKQRLLVVTLLTLAGGTPAGRPVHLAGDADRGARHPGDGRRHLPAGVRDRPGRVPGDPGGREHRADVRDPGRRRRPGPGRRRADRRAPELALAVLDPAAD